MFQIFPKFTIRYVKFYSISQELTPKMCLFNLTAVLPGFYKIILKYRFGKPLSHGHRSYIMKPIDDY